MPAPLPRNGILVAVALVAAIVLAGGAARNFLGVVLTGSAYAAAPAVAQGAAAFVGSAACAVCHKTETDHWRGSHHAHAMDHASDKSVLGDFADAVFDYNGVHSRFFRDNGKFMVETDGPDGKLAPFEIKYTFGVEPLQQYLIEFPDGRLQALSIAWDSRSKEAGGQRWQHLYPKENIGHDDILHWTKLNQNWNFMCAECHSTDVKKNYNAASGRFATTWSEINVGCESCHGAGSRHVDWARTRQSGQPSDDPQMGLAVRFDERAEAVWTRNAGTGAPHRSVAPAELRKEVETCGLCHARRGQLAEGWVPGRSLSETHIVTPITRGLYSADGQMLDAEETYNYVPFKQSKMFAAGVTCSDCHDPHSAKLRRSGDALCLGCHSAEFASAQHHRHEQANPPLSCTSCHMPTRTYMVVDKRHDHSFRIPRPDLSLGNQTPNACNDCHGDKSAGWAAAAVEQWHGGTRKGLQAYAPAFKAAWSDAPDARTLLLTLATNSSAPAVARASALAELATRAAPADIAIARMALRDADPMVRIGALEMLEDLPGDVLWPLASPLLDDPVIGVRVRAASLLAAVPASNQPEADRARFERAAAEFVAAQRLNGDRPEARSALGSFYVQRGRTDEAEAEYLAALRLSPQFAAAAVDLADLYRQTGRDAAAQQVLRSALQASPGDAGLHHSLGLVLVRARNLDGALAELRRAAELEPDRSRYGYVYAIALNSAGRSDEALKALKQGLARRPNDRDMLMAMVSINREMGDNAAALEYAQQLQKLMPGDKNLAALIDALRRKQTE
jgi:predicted CXXCH cytochrome family protein